MDVEEFAADMRPAGRLGDPVAGEQLVEAGITVGVDRAAEVVRVLLRMLALAVWRIEEQGRRRAAAGKRALVADVGPQAAGLGLAGARTGTGVSSTCNVSDPITSAASASTSGCNAAAVAPTQPDSVEVSRLTPSRAKISAWR